MHEVIGQEEGWSHRRSYPMKKVKGKGHSYGVGTKTGYVALKSTLALVPSLKGKLRMTAHYRVRKIRFGVQN